ncbi:hypothetical protein H4R24_002762 [Coemansia sp. RSA 988]|nr:hypothetical protein H4R24_002762 [Coemansia sp. RSA 988]
MPEPAKIRPIACLEFFSGIGGLHYGLQECGVSYSMKMAFDMNENANDVYEHSFGQRPNNKAIDHLTIQDVDQHNSDCWLLSPPCQPYTRGGNYRDIDDPRARGLMHLLDLLPQLQNCPSYVFLENVMNFESSQSRKLLIEVLGKLGFEFDIVQPSSTRTSTFTKAYGSKHLIGSGSLLQTQQMDVVENGFNAPERLLDLGLRFFSPNEVAQLHHFPLETDKSKYTLKFPPRITQRQQLQLLGNGLNVYVVAQLLKHLLFCE